jgi:tetratricopeptide (TPR) repeat protein
MRARLWCWALVLLLSSGAARAQEAASLSAAERTRRSRAHFDLGRAHFNLGEFEAAMSEFEEGYRLKPLPLFLYNIAHSARRANHPQKALEMFKRYLAQNPKASEKKEVEKAIGELEHELAAQSGSSSSENQAELMPPPLPEPPPTVQTGPQTITQTNPQKITQTEPQTGPQKITQTEPQTGPQKVTQTEPQTGPLASAQSEPQINGPEPASTIAEPAPPRANPPPANALARSPMALTRLARPPAWYRDWLGWAITTTGAFALTIGIADLAVTYPRVSGYDPTPGHPNHNLARYDDANSAAPRVAADIAVLSIGAALVVGGAVRFALVARRSRADRFALFPVGDSRFAGVVFGGRF